MQYRIKDIEKRALYFLVLIQILIRISKHFDGKCQLFFQLKKNEQQHHNYFKLLNISPGIIICITQIQLQT